MFRKAIVIFSAIILIGCNGKDPEPQQGEGMKIDVLGAASTKTTSNGLSTIWMADGGSSTAFIPLNHDKIWLSGAHELQMDGGRNLVYFGTELIGGRARVVLFTYEGKKVLSDEVGLMLMTDRQENLYSYHRDAQGNLYLHSSCQTVGYRTISYVYKIDNLLGIEKLDMPADISFALFKIPTGLISLKATYLHDAIEISIAHQIRGIEKARVDLAGFGDQHVHSAYYNQMGRLVLLVSAMKNEDKKPAYLLLSIDPESGKVVRHALNLPKERYNFGKGIMEGNVLFVPGWERSTNRAFYFRIDTQTDLSELSVTRTELETDPQLPLTKASFLQRINGEIYVGGEQFGKACYWKGGKMVRLESDPSIVRSYPIHFLAYRN
ncbi:hypothetical protein [Sphingobacterium sp. HMA12]|uniref:hypothetical protein n=1 Tax=Sphingobacterium sp. HMA12 TaxID=2050894 RepID=UPI0013155A83|nr:hypothetical protein [Sphingobacterium sp. HMA12]